MEMVSMSPSLLLIITAFVTSVDSLKCAQCSSRHTRRCETGDLAATDCTGLHQGARFCVTYSGRILSGRVVFRDCSYMDMNHICKSQLLENEETEVCYETCDTDGCNTVPNSTNSILAIFPRLSFLTILTFILLRIV